MRFDDLFKRSRSRAGRHAQGVARPSFRGTVLRGIRAAIAGVAAVAMMAGAAYAADGGAGSGTGGGGTGDTGAIVWTYKDGNDGSFGDPTAENVKAAMQAVKSGIWIGPWGGDDPDRSINQALTQAVTECQARGNQECRLVGVGFVWSSGTNSYTGAAGGYTAQQWQEAYGASNIPTTTWSHNGVAYQTNKVFSDGVTSVNSLANREMTKDPTHTSVIVIVLGENEPPSNYDLTITTNQQAGDGIKVGATDPVHDVIHASNSLGVMENLVATSTLHYDGSAYVAAKSVSKNVTITSQGDTTGPDFVPSDFGWEYWPEATEDNPFWFDVQVAKQGMMTAAVDTTDHDPAESFTVAAVPSAPPVKSIEDGVSASRMTNTTTITTGTGAGGYEMTIRDTITPNGVDYSISNMLVTDTTTGEDISSQFTMSWDQVANTVTAVRSADQGAMPLNHEWAFTFDVTVSLPSDFQKVQDVATVQWNQEPEQSTDTLEFETWRPQPDKSWIKQDSDGEWAAVIDPDWTNATGGDRNTFMDGDKVASVVNGTIDAHLIDEPTKLVLTDDWGAADYIWDATTDVSEIRVYEADSSSDRQSTVSDIMNKGKDVTDQFDITLDGTTVTATAKASYLKTLKGLENPKQVTLLIPGVINFANGGGAEQVREDFGKEPGAELTFCTDPTAPRSGGSLTNKGSETVNDHTMPTNEPYICGYVPPVEKDVIGEASEGGDQESVDGMVVYPGQRVEYQLLTTPNLPQDLAYDISKVVFIDSYDEYLTPDKQTVEMMDLSTGKVIPKSKYATKWDDGQHLFQLTVTDQTLIGQWRAGGSPRIQVRFEGTVSKDAPTDHKVNNKWMLTLNNSLTPSNEVIQHPAEVHSEQGGQPERGAGRPERVDRREDPAAGRHRQLRRQPRPDAEGPGVQGVARRRDG